MAQQLQQVRLANSRRWSILTEKHEGSPEVPQQSPSSHRSSASPGSPPTAPQCGTAGAVFHQYTSYSRPGVQVGPNLSVLASQLPLISPEVPQQSPSITVTFPPPGSPPKAVRCGSAAVFHQYASDSRSGVPSVPNFPGFDPLSKSGSSSTAAAGPTPPYKGFRNLGNTCWTSAALQALFSLPCVQLWSTPNAQATNGCPP